MPTPTKPLDSWAWKSSDPGHAWVVDIGGIVRPITNELSRLAAGGLFFFDTETHAIDAKQYFGSKAMIGGVTTADVAGVTALIPGSNPANPPFTGVSSGINALGDFFNKLADGNLWLRVGEFAIGAILIGVALAHLTGTDNAVTQVLTKGAIKHV